MIQFIPLVIVPQIFFSGLFPMESMNKVAPNVRESISLTYGADAMRQVMIRNQGFTEIALDLCVITFSLFAVGNVFALKKHRKNNVTKGAFINAEGLVEELIVQLIRINEMNVKCEY